MDLHRRVVQFLRIGDHAVVDGNGDGVVLRVQRRRGLQRAVHSESAALIDDEVLAVENFRGVHLGEVGVGADEDRVQGNVAGRGVVAGQDRGGGALVHDLGLGPADEGVALRAVIDGRGQRGADDAVDAVLGAGRRAHDAVGDVVVRGVDPAAGAAEVERGVGGHALGGGVVAVAVVQLDGGHRDALADRIGAVLRGLIGRGARRSVVLEHDLAGALGGGHACAVLGRVDLARDRDLAVDVDKGVGQIGGVGRDVTDVVGAGRGVADRADRLIVRAAVAAPVLAVVDDDRDRVVVLGVLGVFDIGDDHLRVLGDDDLGAGLDVHILVDGQGAALDFNVEVAVQRQHVVGGVDGQAVLAADDRQGDGVDAAVAVHFEADAVFRRVVVLGEGAAVLHLEQGVRSAFLIDERNGRGGDGAAGVRDGTDEFSRAVFKRHSGLDILDVVLRQREDALRGVHHRHRGGAAAEVHDLERLIDRAALLHRDGARAGDIAPAVEIAAVVDGDVAVLRQLDVAVAAGRRAEAGHLHVLLGGEAQGAVDVQRRARAEGQGAERVGVAEVRELVDRLRIGGVQLEVAAARDQEGVVLRDGVVARRQFAVAQQDDRIMTVRGSVTVRRVQIGEGLRADLELQGAFVEEVRIDHAVAGDEQVGGRVRGQAGEVQVVEPAEERIARLRARDDVEGLAEVLRDRCLLGQRRAVDGIGAVLRHGEGHVDVFLDRELDVVQLQTGAVLRKVAGEHVDVDGLPRAQRDRVAAVARDVVAVDRDRTGVQLDEIVKGQIRGLAGVVFQDQLAGDGLIDGRAAAAFRRNGHRAADVAVLVRLPGAAVIGDCQAGDAFGAVFQLDLRRGCGREDRRADRSDQRDDQRQCNKTLQNLFHFLLPPWFFECFFLTS